MMIRSELVTTMNKATRSAKFQISIPKEVRDEQDWKAGQEFLLIPKRKGVRIMPFPKLEDLKGVAAGIEIHNIRDRYDRY